MKRRLIMISLCMVVTLVGIGAGAAKTYISWRLVQKHLPEMGFWEFYWGLAR